MQDEKHHLRGANAALADKKSYNLGDRPWWGHMWFIFLSVCTLFL